MDPFKLGVVCDSVIVILENSEVSGFATYFVSLLLSMQRRHMCTG